MGKVLKVSRRYLPPFLSYRENPTGGAKYAPLSAGRVLTGTILLARIICRYEHYTVRIYLIRSFDMYELHLNSISLTNITIAIFCPGTYVGPNSHTKYFFAKDWVTLYF